MRSFRVVSISLMSCAVAALAGCSANFVPDLTSNPASTPLGTIKGSLYGGRQPIIGARVFLFAAGTGGNAGPGIAASSSNASTSLLTNSSASGYPTTQDSNATSPTFNDYYVTTDSNGAFGISGEYTCTPGTQVYMYAVGGEAGSGSNNSAIALLAILGQCPVGGTMASVTPTVNMNEISTVAAAYAFAGYATDAVHVSSNGTAQSLTGIANAFANANQLYDVTQSIASTTARSTTPNGNGTVPKNIIHAIANSLAACVNSSGPSSTQCSTNLFNTVMSNGSSGSTPTDIATEAIYIAHNPGIGVSAIFGNTTGIGAPWPTNLASAPNDWTIGISFTGGGLNASQGIAVDSQGSVWTANKGSNSAGKFSPLGVPANSGFTSTHLASPYNVSIDISDGPWFSSNSVNYVTHFTSSGGSSTFYTNANLSTDGRGILVDSSNNVTVTTGNAVVEFTSASSYASANFWHPGGISTSWGLAPSTTAGSIWVASEQEATELVNLSNGSNVHTSDSNTCGKNVPISVAVDSRGFPWTVSDQFTNVYVFNTSAVPVYSTSGCTGSFVTNSVGYSGGGLNTPKNLAIDGNGVAWVANSGNSSITAFTNAGTAITPSTGYTAGGIMNAPWGIIVDQSGDIWITNTGANILVELIGAATPTEQPLSVASGASKLGARP